MANPVHHDAGTEAGEGLKAWRLYLRTCIENAASDLHIKSDAPPKIRIRGELRKMAAPNCTKDLMFQIAKDVLDESQYAMFSQKGQIDFAYDYESTNSDDDVVRRFRVNLFMA